MLSFEFKTTKSWMDTLDDSIYDITGDILLYKSPQGTKEKVGAIYAFYVDIASARDNGLSLFQVFDNHSDAVFRFFPVLSIQKPKGLKPVLLRSLVIPYLTTYLSLIGLKSNQNTGEKT